MMEERYKIPADEQDEYILLQTKPYDSYCGWKEGDKLKRISVWIGSGLRQAYFVHVDKLWRDGTVWENHVKPVSGQLEMELN